jgi:hypothetical protein
VADVELARQQWQEGHRRAQRLAQEQANPDVLALVDQLVEELRQRVGSTFTLGELAASYRAADAWAHETIRDRPDRGRWLSTALDSAYHLYSRGARDYRP